MDQVMTIESVVLQEIQRRWPGYTLDTILVDRIGLIGVLDIIEQRCGVALYGKFDTGRDIVRMIERTKQ